MKQNHKGFTIIELLVVVAIIGLISSIISTNLSNARTRARDTRRISDVKQVKSGMDIFFATADGYPSTNDWDTAPGGIIMCDGKHVLTIPSDPQAANGYDYEASGTQTVGCGITVQPSYEFEFFIETQDKWYRMDEGGDVSERDTGIPVSFDSLLN